MALLEILFLKVMLNKISRMWHTVLERVRHCSTLWKRLRKWKKGKKML